MQIVLLSAEYWPTPGGVGDYTQHLGATLARSGHAVTVWTIRGDRLVALDPTRPHDAALVEFGPAHWDWSCWHAIANAVQQVRPDVLHIQYQTGAYAMHPSINLLPWRLQRLPNRPRLLVTAHDLLLPYLFPKATLLRNWVTRRLLEDSDAAIVTNADDLAVLVGQHANPDRSPRFAGRLKKPPWLIPIGSNIAVQPPPAYDRAAWRAGLGIGPAEHVIVYFGLISPTKGLDGLLDALQQLPAQFRLLIIGGEAPAPQDRAYAKALRARIASPAFQGRVISTGQCPEAEVSAHLLAADIAALPFADGASFRRGSLLAALAHGLAVVTTAPPVGQPVPATPELPELIDQQNVALVPIGDAHALAARLQQLADQPELRAQLGRAAAELAHSFTWEAIAARHQDLYHQLLRTP